MLEVPFHQGFIKPKNESYKGNLEGKRSPRLLAGGMLIFRFGWRDGPPEETWDKSLTLPSDHAGWLLRNLNEVIITVPHNSNLIMYLNSNPVWHPRI